MPGANFLQGLRHPLVSIMIPTYGQADSVCRAIDSARAQTYPHLDIVIADDCSPDDTEHVVRAHLERIQDPRVRYHRHAANLGILRNYHETLFHLTRGDWVVNLDGDDYFIDLEFIERAVSLAERDDRINLITANYCEVTEPVHRRIDIVNRGLPEVLSGNEFLMRFAVGQILWNHSAILYRRAEALKHGCYWHPVEPRNDWESFLRIVALGKVGHLPLVASAWVQHGTNETRRLDMAKYLNNFRLIDGVARFCRDHGQSADFVAAWKARMFRKSAASSTGAYAKQGDLRGLLSFLWRVRKLSAWTACRTLVSPGLWVRLMLSRHPALYDLVKARLRGSSHG